MDTADIDLVALPLLRQHKITTDEYYRMAEIGIIRKEMRVELIGGQIIDMAPIGRRHQLVIDELTRILLSRVDANTTVRVQGPVRLDNTMHPSRMWRSCVAAGRLTPPTTLAPRTFTFSSRSPIPAWP